MNRAPLNLLAYLAGLLSGAIVLVVAFIVHLAGQPLTTPGSTDELLDRFDAQLERVEDLHCGSIDAAGCFVAPDLIQVDTGVGELEHDVVLHELGHLIQYRLGLPADECQADAFAILFGATHVGYEC